MDYRVTDLELTSVADAIRAKGSTSAPLEWPDGYAQAVTDLPSGGGSGDNYKIVMGIMSGSIYDNELTSVGEYALYSHQALTGAEMRSVIVVGSNAFASCKSLNTISFPACTKINNYGFGFCVKLTTASFPSCTSIGNWAFTYCSSLTAISFPVCTYIGSSAFLACSSLTTASFPACISIGLSLIHI